MFEVGHLLEHLRFNWDLFILDGGFCESGHFGSRLSLRCKYCCWGDRSTETV